MAKRLRPQPLSYVDIKNSPERHTSHEAGKQLLADLINGGDIAATSVKLSLKCKLKTTRIEVPVRSVNCRPHLECVDLRNYLDCEAKNSATFGAPTSSRRSQRPVWACPVCGNRAMAEDLRVDDYFAHILKTVPASVDEVRLLPDGSFEQLSGAGSDVTIDDEEPFEPQPEHEHIRPSGPGQAIEELFKQSKAFQLTLQDAKTFRTKNLLRESMESFLENQRDAFGTLLKKVTSAYKIVETCSVAANTPAVGPMSVQAAAPTEKVQPSNAHEIFRMQRSSSLQPSTSSAARRKASAAWRRSSACRTQVPFRQIRNVYQGKVTYVPLPLTSRPRTFITVHLNRILPFDDKIPKNADGPLRDAYEAASDIINGTTASKSALKAMATQSAEELTASRAPLMPNTASSSSTSKGGVVPVSETPELYGTDLPDVPKQSAQDERDNAYCAILKRLVEDTDNVRPFLGPVPDEVKFYYDTVDSPICLAEVEQKVLQNEYHDESLFIADITLMFSNCYKFNRSRSPYYEKGYNLNKTFLELCKRHFPSSTLLPQLPEQKPNVKKH